MNTCLSDLGKAIKQCDEMLASTPVNLNEGQLSIWKSMKPLTVDWLRKQWLKVSSEPLIDLANAEFCEWDFTQETYDESIKCHGMRHKKTNKPHGIVRGMTNEGHMMSEASWFEGAIHGLARMLYDD